MPAASITAQRLGSACAIARNPARRRLFRLQRRIFRSLEAEAELLLGKPPLAIRQYARESQQDFRSASKRAIPATKTEIVKAMQSADVAFVADFHPFAQAQKTALRLIREAIYAAEHEWLIGLELIPSHFQHGLAIF